MKRILAIAIFCCALLIVVVSSNFQKIGFTTSFERMGETMAHAIDVNGTVSSADNFPVLNHLACIMDGNRRWARQRGWKPWYGHREGVEATKRVVQFCIERNISYLSLYTFSVENFKRSPEETHYLFKLIAEETERGLEEFKRYGIRLRFLGDRNLFPSAMKQLLERVEQETAHLNVLTLVFFFCYGGQQEIHAAVKDVAHKVATGEIAEEDITPEIIEQSLWTKDLPAPDLILRTGGHSRLSNFFLYKAAYSELYFLDCLWPDLTVEHLQQAYETYLKSHRKFGV